MDWVAWVNIIGVPVISALFFYLVRQGENTRCFQTKLLRELSDFKLEVAKNYVTTFEMREMERRITENIKGTTEKEKRRTRDCPASDIEKC